MSAKQIALPFRARRKEHNPSVDLIGRSYADGEATITVMGICPTDDRRVMVQRDLDGRTWSMPGWLMRLVFLDQKGKRAA